MMLYQMNIKKITQKQRENAQTLAGLGLTDADISRVVGIAEATLQRRCREELDIGRAKAKAAVAQTAFKMAVSGKFPAMTIFWCKTQLRFREPTSELLDELNKPENNSRVVFVKMPDNGRETPES
jgi:IS30 family transposase